ncbi:mitochondrial resolvase Ydc2 [Xylariaceae sp. FL1651]|nr:mitochondrial resolvase Ydc2 [Xylariaceae sp. FL1651]
MAMAASNPATGVIPRTLRVERLKRLAFLCGLPLGGRKEELIARLIAASDLPSPSKSRLGPVVLSIDLGIRNLAFSLLTPASQTPAAKQQKRKSTRSPPPSTTEPLAVKLHAWQRLSLLDAAASAGARSGDDDDADLSLGAFTPAALAKTANAFLQETVLQFKPLPTHILIERQRWRSGGAPAIQEWTVRVNTLEAMLHASLRTLQDVGVWRGEVVSVRPERVGQLFLEADRLDAVQTKGSKELEEDETDEVKDIKGERDSSKKPRMKQTGSRKTGAETKKLKIDLLGRWLGQRDLVVQPGNPEVGRMLDAYRDTLKGTKRSKSKLIAEEAEIGGEPLKLGKKLDDLTDSLLQGIAWLRWQENTALLRRHRGLEQLL